MFTPTLFYLASWEERIGGKGGLVERRAWKSADWNALDALREEGWSVLLAFFFSNPQNGQPVLLPAVSISRLSLCSRSPAKGRYHSTSSVHLNGHLAPKKFMSMPTPTAMHLASRLAMSP